MGVPRTFGRDCSLKTKTIFLQESDWKKVVLIKNDNKDKVC